MSLDMSLLKNQERIFLPLTLQSLSAKTFYHVRNCISVSVSTFPLPRQSFICHYAENSAVIVKNLLQMLVSFISTIVFLLKHAKTCNMVRGGCFSQVQMGTALSEKYFFWPLFHSQPLITKVLQLFSENRCTHFFTQTHLFFFFSSSHSWKQINHTQTVKNPTKSSTTQTP